MTESTENKNSSLRYWHFLFLLLGIGVLVLIAIPSSLQSPESKINWIINNLRQIDAAKNQWAFEHVPNITKIDQVSVLTNQPSEEDLTPYLHFQNKKVDVIPSIAGEIYIINPLNKSPEAKLVNKIDMPWPKGSIIRFSENPKLNAYLEIIFPDGTTTNIK